MALLLSGFSTLSSNTIKVNVIDTGIGIEAENLRKLFKNFTQISESYSKLYTGAGLGLVISKDLAKLLGGDMGVDSVYGRGSDFWFTFKTKTPLLVSDKKLDSKLEFKRKPHKDLNSKRILVVDDNATNRLVAGEILRESGLVADEVDSAMAAIQASNKNAYDVILMDIQMPEMDGIQGMNHIKKAKPKQVIIAMTALDENNESKKFLDMGFDGYLPKPITQKSLIQTIENIDTIHSSNTLNISETYNL